MAGKDTKVRAEMMKRRKQAAAKEKKDTAERRAGVRKQLKNKRKPK